MSSDWVSLYENCSYVSVATCSAQSHIKRSSLALLLPQKAVTYDALSIPSQSGLQCYRGQMERTNKAPLGYLCTINNIFLKLEGSPEGVFQSWPLVPGEVMVLVGFGA